MRAVAVSLLLLLVECLRLSLHRLYYILPPIVKPVATYNNKPRKSFNYTTKAKRYFVEIKHQFYL